MKLSNYFPYCLILIVITVVVITNNTNIVFGLSEFLEGPTLNCEISDSPVFQKHLQESIDRLNGQVVTITYN